MMVIDVKADVSEIVKRVDLLKKEQIPFATALALTRTAQYAKTELVAEMDRVFEAPTRFTKDALYVSPAKKTNLTATVKVKDHAVKGNAAVKWLFPEIYGGARGIKGFEALLMRSGILPSGWFAIPAMGAPFDAFGNVPGSLITKILSQLQASRDSTANENKEARGKRDKRRQQGRYFAVIPNRPPTNHLPPGIYERFGTTKHAKVVPIFVFTNKAPKYTARYDFLGIGTRVAKARFPIEFEAAAKQAMATAR